MAAIDYPTTRVPAWHVPELHGDELADIKASTFTNPSNRRWAHGERSEWEETMRAPIRMAYLLRKTMHTQRNVLAQPIGTVQEAEMLGSINAFMGGYYGVRKFITTPVPFPLIQMAGTHFFLSLRFYRSLCLIEGRQQPICSLLCRLSGHVWIHWLGSGGD
jgi:hypothetical protein